VDDLPGAWPDIVKYGYVNVQEARALSELRTMAKKDEGALPDYAELATALSRDNLPLFGLLFLRHQPVPFLPALWQEMRKDKDVIIELPRSFSKTSVVTLARTTQRICYAAMGEWNPPRILIMQETATMAEKSVTAIRETVLGGYGPDGPRNLLGYAFGDFHHRVVRRAPNMLWLDLGGHVYRDPTLEGIGIEGAVTGGHLTDMLLDDPESWENARTPQSRQRHWDWWVTTPNGMIDPGTFVAHMCTPKFSDDLRGRRKKRGKSKSIRMPALNRWPEEGVDFEPVYELDAEGNHLLNDEGGTRRIWVRMLKRALEGGDGLPPLQSPWPCPRGHCVGPDCADGGVNMTEDERRVEVRGTPMHRSPEYLIHEKWYEDRMGFATEFMLEDVDSAEQHIKKHMLRFWSDDIKDIDKPTEYNENVILAWPQQSDIVMSVHAWDHAIGTTVRHDETAVAQMYRTKDNKVFVRCDSGHWEPEHVKRMMESRFHTDPFRRPETIVTEAINFERMFGEGVKETAGSIVPLTMVTHAKDKFTSMVENGYFNALCNGRIYFHVDDAETISQHLLFTGARNSRGRDDRVDACRLAFGAVAERVGRAARTYRGRPTVSRT
jgi:hypothetical protein